MNRIVTRGLGVSRGAPGRAGPVTMGYGPSFVQVVIETVANLFRTRHGRSSKRHREDELITVWAEMVEVNGHPPDRAVRGSTRVAEPASIGRVIIEHVSTRAKSVINIIARRLR